MEEIEVVIVNDCSPDPIDSAIMREYAEKYPDRVKCIWHEKNKRQGGARNTGIRVAAGDFIYCLDSDDYIELTLCEKMYDAIRAEDADMAVCDCERIETDVAISRWKNNGDFTSDDPVDRIRSLRGHTAWLIMIRKSIIVEKDLFFSEHIEFEDLLCTLWYLAAKKIARVHEVLHHYVIRDDSITQTRKLETFELSLHTISLILQSLFFRNLERRVKETVFLYLMRYVPDWTIIVNTLYFDSLPSFCRKILQLEDSLGFAVNAIKFESEYKNQIVNLFAFIRTNVQRRDFCLEYSAYHQYQNDLYRLRRCRASLQKYEGKRITIWGAGRRGERNAGILMRLGVNFALTDNNSKLYGGKIVDKIVIRPWSELREHTDIVFISVVGHYDEIAEAIRSDTPEIAIEDFDRLTEWNL
jgi:glycosyltransferase involved in cell wall biosynthesis